MSPYRLGRHIDRAAGGVSGAPQANLACVGHAESVRAVPGKEGRAGLGMRWQLPGVNIAAIVCRVSSPPMVLHKTFFGKSFY